MYRNLYVPFLCLSACIAYGCGGGEALTDDSVAEETTGSRRQADSTWQFFELRVQHTNKCLDVSGISGANGAPVVQWDCWGGGNQKWRLEPVENNYVQIRVEHTNKCLDVSGISGDNGAPVVQWDCWGGGNQKWRLEPIGGGYVQVRVQHTNKCLDVSGISGDNGAPVVQWDCWGGGNQKWRLSPINP